MQWFQIKEQSAGKKRLILSWYLYRIFGKNVLYLIAFLVSFFTFLFAKKVRYYSKKYLEVSYIKNKLKPSLLNQFKHINSYANSLVDKILVYSNDFDRNKIVFDDKDEFDNDIKSGNGAFLICSHIGNIEIFESYLINEKQNFNVNIFVSKKQSTIFNDFLKSIKKDFPAKFYPVEDIDINTGVELKESLNKGDIVFIAGDRLAQDNYNKNFKAKMYNKDVLLPKGTFKLAKLMEVPVYFISAIKIKDNYKVIIEKQNDLSLNTITANYTKYLENVLQLNPFQFFNFFDFFIDDFQ